MHSTRSSLTDLGSPPRSSERVIAESGLVRGVVKFYRSDRRWGFLRLNEVARDAFICKSVLPPGVDELAPGTTVVARLILNAHGPEVAEILEIDESTARPEAARPPLGPVERAEGVLKRVHRRGYAFVTLDGGGDAFVSARMTAKAGLTLLPLGTRLELRVAAAAQGPVATLVKPLFEGGAKG